MSVPIVLGSDKMAVSVAGRHTKYWPLYISVGNVLHTVRRPHANAMALIAFSRFLGVSASCLVSSYIL